MSIVESHTILCIFLIARTAILTARSGFGQ